MPNIINSINKAVIKHNIGYLLTLVSLCFLMHACSPVEEKEELYGTYIVEYPFGTETLILNADGQYIQEVYITEHKETLVHKGAWRFTPEDQYVALENGLSVINGFGELDKDYNIPFDGLVLRGVIRYTPWGQIRLQSGYEEIQYFKVKQ